MRSIVKDVKTTTVSATNNSALPIVNVSTAVPPILTPAKGSLVYDVISNQVFFSNGATWASVSSGGGSPSGPAGGSLAGTYPNPTLAPGAVTAAAIAPGSITAAQIAPGTITATQIAPGTITATQIAPGTITATQITNNTITAAQIAPGTITATQIANNTITATQIANNTITAAQLDATPAGPGPWTNATITLDSSGRVIAASSGSASVYSKVLVRNSTAGTFVTPGSGIVNMNSQVGTTVGWSTLDGGDTWTTSIGAVYQVNATIFNAGGSTLTCTLITTQQNISFTVAAGTSMTVSQVVELLPGGGIQLVTSAGATLGGLDGVAARTTMSAVSLNAFP